MNGKIWETPIRAVIFDNDGTLMNTEWAYDWANEEMVGQKINFDTKAMLLGKNSKETCKILCERYNIKEPVESFEQKRTSLLKRCWSNCPLMEGAMEIVDMLHDEMHVPMAIATSSRRSMLTEKTKKWKSSVFYKFHHSVCGDEVKRSKPAPDIFLQAMNAFQIKNDGNIHQQPLKPEEILIFEDSPSGILAGNMAGMATCFIPDKKCDPKELLSTFSQQNTKLVKSKGNNNVLLQPTLTIHSLLDFNPDLFNWDPLEV